MKLTPPKTVTWWIAVILGVLGLIGSVASVGFLSTYAFWFVFVAFALLVIATLLKDL